MINFVKQFSLFNFSTMESQPAMVTKLLLPSPSPP
jgi:hypothetical protein